MIAEKLAYQPKGGMCKNCLYKAANCSHFDFSKMVKISKGDSDGVVIVRCSNYKSVIET